ncbi:MAG: protein jag [Candidatus Abyssobacteria bacterium SURF_5]|uniref:RNA-binding protein KhpB n=1 Tax=Abyssobacteria bacterium (strain SURF_5) TaxID=2093360 RepID=A0A3A4NJT1_ABYX5|nr:MAG: protein jag [Candidatus Abyssubacteria bacterium SURF_5]
MISIEVEGKTPEEAIRKALEVLDTTRDKVQVEVIDEGSKGLFGMIGSKQAKVRATLVDSDDVAPAQPATPDFSPRATVTATLPPRPIVEQRSVVSAPPGSAKQVLEELLHHMGFSARITEKASEDKIVLSIEAGEDSNILIGRRGKNLEGLQYIVSRICAKREDNSKPVLIDVEGYRQRRKEMIESMARRLASKAKSSRREMETEPLSAGERRLVHMALKDDHEVHTQSRGEGPLKNVVIKPKR